MKKKVTFPLRVEKNGVTVLVYGHRPKSGYVSYVVTHHIGGRRQRRTFSDLTQAKPTRRRARPARADLRFVHRRCRPPDLIDARALTEELHA